MTSDRDAIFATLDELHAAQQAHDFERMLATFATTGGFVNELGLRAAFDEAVEKDLYRGRTADMAECETFIYRDTALVKPVSYQTRRGPRYRSYHFKKDGGGRWRIIDSNRSLPRGARCYTDELIANAGKLIGDRGMLWVRRFDVPVEKVWEAVSTKQGLDRWFLTRSCEIDLRPGGLFRHHWTNTIKDFRTHEFIDFVGTIEDHTHPRYLMRFELKRDGDGTLFSFLDTFAGAPYPLSLPLTCSGWHCCVDALERALTGSEIENDFGLGGEFYFRHLRDLQRMTALRATVSATESEQWRAAFLTDSV